MSISQSNNSNNNSVLNPEKISAEPGCVSYNGEMEIRYNKEGGDYEVEKIEGEHFNGGDALLLAEYAEELDGDVLDEDRSGKTLSEAVSDFLYEEDTR